MSSATPSSALKRMMPSCASVNIMWRASDHSLHVQLSRTKQLFVHPKAMVEIWLCLTDMNTPYQLAWGRDSPLEENHHEKFTVVNFSIIHTMALMILTNIGLLHGFTIRFFEPTVAQLIESLPW